MLKLATWNVNGLRAIVKKDFVEWLEGSGIDVIGLQETKAQDDQVREALFGLEGYEIITHSAEKKGYSSTAVLTKVKPLSVARGLGEFGVDDQGRALTVEFEDFYFLTVYTPNSAGGLIRLPGRMIWDAAFKQYVASLDAKKPVVICGDLNVAHQAIDLANPKSNYNKTPGYTQDEIDGMSTLLDAGFTDLWRAQHPDEVGYSWWSYRATARARNIGWRLDYFLGSPALDSRYGVCKILSDVMGSDHCPVTLELNA